MEVLGDMWFFRIGKKEDGDKCFEGNLGWEFFGGRRCSGWVCGWNRGKRRCGVEVEFGIWGDKGGIGARSFILFYCECISMFIRFYDCYVLYVIGADLGLFFTGFCFRSYYLVYFFCISVFSIFDLWGWDDF